MINKEKLIKIFDENMILDSIQYFNSITHKLHSAKISLEALENIVLDQVEVLENEYGSLFKEANGNVTLKVESIEDKVEFYGVEINRKLAIDKLTIEIFSILHGFFDNLAQYLNTVLFANDGVCADDVSFHKLTEELDNFIEYPEELRNLIKGAKDEIEFKYLRDVNNVIKHRFQILSSSSFNIFNGIHSLLLPEIVKKNRVYDKRDLVEIVTKCFMYCETFFDLINESLIDYFSSNKHQRVSGRIYNPKIYIVFENDKNFKEGKPQQSMYYIQQDSNLLLDYYSILMKRIDNDKNVHDIYNCPYIFIAVVNEKKAPLGYLKPCDTTEYELVSGRPSLYRKYELIKENFHGEYFENLFAGVIKYHPLLTDAEIIILNKEGEKTKGTIT